MSVTPELHERVLRRDGRCIGAMVYPGEHVCRDQWGTQHMSDDLARMTVDHVHLVPGGIRGKRAPDDEAHLVTMCAYLNIYGPSRGLRDAERAYLRSLYPEAA